MEETRVLKIILGEIGWNPLAEDFELEDFLN